MTSGNDRKDRPAAQPSSAGSVRASNAGDQRFGSRTGPADEAPKGTAGTGENFCRICAGSGVDADTGKACPACQGTGRVTEGIGGA